MGRDVVESVPGPYVGYRSFAIRHAAALNKRFGDEVETE